MSIDDIFLTNCPVCNSKLSKEPTRGDYYHYTCENHGRFGVSSTLAAMANNNPSVKEDLSIRIKSAQSSEEIEMITTDNLNN
ncbi:TPA: hypothetical protein U2L65_003934 [Citrobacter farmeri]|uniref:hypothetical protein n=1 Tax=Citrobacter TaxID=544 RepID=UPI00294542DD|nr:hypothetical protein [Citrobacter amalonaticus]HEM7973402.1 hypothetical protein [Citrobacter farmeri]HEM7987108.1 hypothetical protein [Citrobacter farmeri]